jgi:menaquinol-cytochrome c reductase cytochrome b/c subunit
VSTRDWMICLFTGFFVTFIILTISGTFFRGQGMHLYWPWDPHQTRVE